MAAWPYNTATWRDLRRAKLAAQPVCEQCEKRGLSVLAEAVDHIHELRHGGDPFPALSGLMSLCTACHSIKTNAVTAGRANVWKGCDLAGNPLGGDW
jgi:5-methylcytosine-specific restriction endonuclease McrA